MSIRKTIAIIIAKILIKILRLIGRGGTTLPGKVAMKICPDIAVKITAGFNIIMVTGTNGKTTTSRIISRILEENGIEHISNKSGANLVSGVISIFIENVDFFGKSSINTALIEIDEAAFQKISQVIEPKVLVVTNFFRDQLDRYGELYTTLNGVKKGISNFKNTTIVLNADDSLCASIGHDTDIKILYYGVSQGAAEDPSSIESSDAAFCIYCKTKYEYSYNIYGHLGGFTCPGCGYKRPSADVQCISIKSLTDTHSIISLSFLNAANEPETTENVKVNLPGLYNIYNALAGAACGHALGLPSFSTVKALSSFQSGFGRMETIHHNGKYIKVILVKNPTGFNQVLNYLSTCSTGTGISFLINDNLADGTDISWLWDVDFEKLTLFEERIKFLYTSGQRAEDMAVRLKYAGLNLSQIDIIKDYSRLLDVSLSNIEEGGTLYLLPTYTAMLEIREILKKRFNLKDFWK